MGAKIGLDCKLYRNTGSYAVPVWNEVTVVVDANLNLEKAVAEIKARNTTWATNKTATKSATIEYPMLADTAVDDYNALRDAFLNDTIVDIAVADGPIATTGTQYFRAETYVSAFARGEPLEGVATINVAHVLAYSSNAPIFVTV